MTEACRVTEVKCAENDSVKAEQVLVLRLATEGQTVEKPSDVIKNPLVLELIGLKPEASYNCAEFDIITVVTCTDH